MKILFELAGRTIIAIVVIYCLGVIMIPKETWILRLFSFLIFIWIAIPLHDFIESVRNMKDRSKE